MKDLKIALLQATPEKTVEENLYKGIEFCRKAKLQGSDIALFPEMWSIGYNIFNVSEKDWTKKAVESTSDFVKAFKREAANIEMAIAITLLEKTDEKPKNSLILFDRKGEKVLSYSKVHTCDFSAERNLSQGDEFYVSTLDTAKGKIKVGAMICYDREFPESARILMIKGAELILTPNACPMEINRLSQLRSRAYENMLAIATCNYPNTVEGCNGGSTIFDGIAYEMNKDESRDMCVLKAGEKEGIYVGSIDIESLRLYRATECQGNSYRRPKKYSLLTKEEKESPFIREDYRP